jgi:exodeoxyribonuclease V gamma subunit
MRELEVLHDQLLAMFDADPALTPRDILVTMPDVERYAPFIEAVFGAPESRQLAIPFTIADRTVRAENCLADTLLDLLDLTTSRFGAAAVLAVLNTRPVRRRFELSEADLETIRDWIDRTSIRWGIDAAHRASFDLPAFDANTWRAGLRRLLLGYALPGDGESLFDDVLPIREIEGNLALTLGRFVEFAEALFSLAEELRAARPLAEWEHTLRQMLTTFFDEEEEPADAIRRLRAALEQLGKVQREADFTAPVEFAVLRAHLAQLLAESDSGAGFLAGRVTFCALKPMRSIPFKVLCLIGLNDTAFPRRDAALAFDRVAQKPRPGDRSLRDDDRQLFLESILSAREALYISYCGRSPRDNSEAPPSVLVSELLDYLEQNFGLTTGKLREDLLVTQHRLQPFHTDYFRAGARLFSYSAENARASEQSRLPRSAPAGFAAEPLPEPGDEWLSLDWEKLAEFLSCPAKFFARERLGMALPQECTPLEECEPLELDQLHRYSFEQTLTRRALAGEETADQLQIARASGQLPPGYAGDAEFAKMRTRTVQLTAEIRQHITGEPLPPLAIDLQLGDFRLSGTLRDRYPAALLRHRAATLKSKICSAHGSRTSSCSWLWMRARRERHSSSALKRACASLP